MQPVDEAVERAAAGEGEEGDDRGMQKKTATPRGSSVQPQQTCTSSAVCYRDKGGRWRNEQGERNRRMQAFARSCTLRPIYMQESACASEYTVRHT